MYFSDLLFITQWWFVFLVIGVVFLPLTIFLFPKFFDKGYIFSKILGVAFVSYVVFVLGTLTILPFSGLTIFITLSIFFFLNILISQSASWRISISFLKRFWKIFLFEELLFFGALTFWSFIRGFQPDIHGLEKYMDYGFINSILRSEYFPPRDMWFTPFAINYYYFGHLVTAVLTKASLLPANITYNLMLATIFAFTFTCSFSIGANLLWFNVILKPGRLKDLGLNQILRFAQNDIKTVFFGGFLSAFLATLAGNLHTIFTFFKPYTNENPVPFWKLAFSPETFPNTYWYPNATRFIHNTIHEFPIYSFVVSDLHGHVLDIPFVLLIIAVLLSLIFNFQFSIFNQIKNYKNSNSLQLVLISFLLAVMYMTNAWDSIIYALLTLIVFIYFAYRSKNYMLYAIYYTLILIGFILFSLPFSLHFKPFASGIGVLCAPEFLTKVERLGPFLFEPNHCQHSPLWQLFILYGFFYFWTISFLVFLFRGVILKPGRLKDLGLNQILRFAQNDILKPDFFVLLLLLLSTLLIILPEFIYAKDIYPAHYRANTMFKFVYQAFIMLSLSSGYIILRIITNFKYTYWKLVVFGIGSIGLLLVSVYPYFAITSYYGNLQTYYGLDGTKYLQKLYPADYAAIGWLNKNAKGQPVTLEAQGDSYTDFARVSAHTGLPTLLGWTVHEWLWRGTYDVPSPRIEEVRTLYETTDAKKTKELIDKYDISLVFIGDLERQKYPNLNEEKFQHLGKIIYQNGRTKIYKL